jgi:hypothetical protein
MLYLEYSFILCWILDISGSRWGTPGKFWSVVLEKHGEDQLDQHLRNEEVLLRVKKQRNILHEISKRKANQIGYILRRNCLLRQVIKGNIKGGIKVKGRRGRRRRKLVNDLKERRGYSHLKKEALNRAMWRTRFWSGFDCRETDEWMNECLILWRHFLAVLVLFFGYSSHANAFYCNFRLCKKSQITGRS